MEKKRSKTHERHVRKCLAHAILASGLLSSCTGLGGNRMAARPFVKWVGGKGQLIGQLSPLLPKDLSERAAFVYVEPFVGGGAMLFYVLSRYPNIERAVANDLNVDLVTTYKVVQNKPEQLITTLAEMQRTFYARTEEPERRAYYLDLRERYNSHPSDDVEIAALFIFLNRTCFNGLYRVNAKGQYNVPFGKAVRPLICDADNLRAASALLQKVEFLCGDFESIGRHVQGRAFWYFDPPYRPLTPTASFTAYSKDGFGDNQQRRLAAFCRRLDTAGHQWLLSNSDPHNVDPEDTFFEDIFAGFEIRRVSAARMVNSKTDGRGKITELAIRNYGE